MNRNFLLKGLLLALLLATFVACKSQTKAIMSSVVAVEETGDDQGVVTLPWLDVTPTPVATAIVTGLTSDKAAEAMVLAGIKDECSFDSEPRTHAEIVWVSWSYSTGESCGRNTTYLYDSEELAFAMWSALVDPEVLGSFSKPQFDEDRPVASDGACDDNGCFARRAGVFGNAVVMVVVFNRDGNVADAAIYLSIYFEKYVALIEK